MDSDIEGCSNKTETASDHIMILLQIVLSNVIVKTRKAKHIRNETQQKNGSNIGKHAWDNKHITDFDNKQVIEKENFQSYLILKSWHTTKDRNADNNSKPHLQLNTVLIKKT